MKWQWFRILATSHRLPSSKTDISSHLLCLPLSFQKVCSSKLQTGIQPAEMQRGLSVQWHDCIRDAEQWPKWLHILLMSRGVGRCSCFGRGWYFLLVSWAGEKAHSAAKIAYCKSIFPCVWNVTDWWINFPCFCCYSVPRSCLTLYDPMNCCTPGALFSLSLTFPSLLVAPEMLCLSKLQEESFLTRYSFWRVLWIRAAHFVNIAELCVLPCPLLSPRVC